ncbi:DUF4268 domain-containing protein [Leptospira vanthielii]|uniref:DUF4268 domain-containing protein n=1 Tax=Leptospira vanthielii TaxID=293085 RepID=A0ABY2NT44_9LEPT|nr:DUF4268 domain-containing protein [Leptospira vanthielii]TGM60813.1 DUF4268 domain-containing protein [Leptospira vanthielii]
MKILGKLEKVELREVWKNESSDFTPWLANEENISILGETIGIEMEVEAREKEVGPFKADILCKNTLDNSWILIENQLEKTDHTHLGQILTYAAGLNAVTIIWIAKKFTEEHRATIDWLNEKTENQINFFGIEIELFKIENSPVAPMFNLVSKPNNWHKSISQAAREMEITNLTETKILQKEYWEQLEQFLRLNSKIIKPTKPLPQHWTNFAIGKSYFTNCAIINSRDKKIAVHLSITGDKSKENYKTLLSSKQNIEKETNLKLIWEELPDAIESRIKVELENIDPSNKENWNKMIEWHKNCLEEFDKLFRERIKNI